MVCEMKGPTPTAVRTFDLRAAGGSFASIQRTTLFLILAVEIMLTAFGIWFGFKLCTVALTQSITSTSGAGFSFALGLVIVLLAVLFPITSRFLSGATEVALTDTEVILRYPRGRSESFQWANPKTRFLLYDYSVHPRMVQDGRAYSVVIPWGRVSMLTEDCHHAILTKARDQGSRITQYKGSPALYGFSPVIHCIQGARFPPRPANFMPA
jgi:hypothetical protein